MLKASTTRFALSFLYSAAKFLRVPYFHDRPWQWKGGNWQTKIIWACNKSGIDIYVVLCIITGTPTTLYEAVFKCKTFSGGILLVAVFGDYDIGVMPSAGGVLNRWCSEFTSRWRSIPWYLQRLNYALADRWIKIRFPAGTGDFFFATASSPTL